MTWGHPVEVTENPRATVNLQKQRSFPAGLGSNLQKTSESKRIRLRMGKAKAGFPTRFINDEVRAELLNDATVERLRGTTQRCNSGFARPWTCSDPVQGGPCFIGRCDHRRSTSYRGQLPCVRHIALASRTQKENNRESLVPSSKGRSHLLPPRESQISICCHGSVSSQRRLPNHNKDGIRSKPTTYANRQVIQFPRILPWQSAPIVKVFFPTCPND